MNDALHILIPVVLFASPALASDYTFIKIADSSGELGDNFGWPDINDDGTVTFWNTHDNGTTTAIYTGNGGRLTQQVNNLGTYKQLHHAPAINDSGTVVFWAEKTSNNTRGIFKVDNGVVTIVADAANSLFYDFDALPSINNSGAVAYSGNIDQPCCGSAIGVGAGVLYDPSGPFISFYNDAAINNNGLVAFGASFDGFTSNGIFTGVGGGFTTIATDAGGSIFTGFSMPPSINDSGAVAFHAFQPGGVTGIFVGSGGPVTPIATTTGPFQSFGPNGAAALNNNGDVAFFAILDAGSAAGIFTGPDPATDTVIKFNDPLFGSTVYGGLTVFRGINSHGDIAFTYTLKNASGGAGASGVAIAKAPVAALPEDIDGDGDVDGADLGLLLGAWGTNDPASDLNNDGTVDGADVGLLLGAWTG